jgi:hypothetical protein
VPGSPLGIPANLIDVSLISKTAGEDSIVLNPLNLEPTFDEVAAGLGLGALAHTARL